jgi:Ca-activated chloride channel homolog
VGLAHLRPVSVGAASLMRTGAILILAAFAAPFAPSASSAQPPSRPQFSAGTDLVVLHATVKNRQDGYVTNLPEDAFTVLDGGERQSIRFFTSEDAPVTVGLVIDNSGSMQPNRPEVIAAAQAFAESSNPEDQIFALAFDEDVRSALPASAPFTSDTATLRAALDRTLNTRGRTALFDAVDAGLRYLNRGSRERKVLVVVSDGGDNASHVTFDDMLRRAEASNALIYTVAIVDELDEGRNPKLLKRLAQATGGEAFAPHDIRQVVDVLRHIAKDIRHTYTIGYVPTNQADDGTFRKIRLIVQPPGGERVSVRTREGYIAGPTREGQP